MNDEINELKAEIANLKQLVNSLITAPVIPKPTFPQPSSRRKMLSHLAIGLALAAVNLPNQKVSAEANVSAIGSSTAEYGLSAAPNGVTLLVPPPASGIKFGVIGTTDNDAPAAEDSPAGVFGSSTGNAGVLGSSVSNFGVFGNSSTSHGIYGRSSEGNGVHGLSTLEAGVYGESVEDIGVLGLSNEDIGIKGLSLASNSGYGGGFDGGLAPLYLFPATSEGHPSINEHLKGEIFVDKQGDFYACVQDGEPGLWRKVAGASSAGLLHFLPISDRFVDTRNGVYGGITGPITPNVDYNFTMVGRTGRDGQIVPNSAVGIVGNITVINPIGNGYLKVLPSTTPNGRGTSAVNFNSGFNTANAFHCRLISGRIQVTLFVATSVELAIDIVGYYL